MSIPRDIFDIKKIQNQLCEIVVPDINQAKVYVSESKGRLDWVVKWERFKSVRILNLAQRLCSWFWASTRMKYSNWESNCIANSLEEILRQQSHIGISFKISCWISPDIDRTLFSLSSLPLVSAFSLTQSPTLSNLNGGWSHGVMQRLWMVVMADSSFKSFKKWMNRWEIRSKVNMKLHLSARRVN